MIREQHRVAALVAAAVLCATSSAGASPLFLGTSVTPAATDGLNRGVLTPTLGAATLVTLDRPSHGPPQMTSVALGCGGAAKAISPTQLLISCGHLPPGAIAAQYLVDLARHTVIPVPTAADLYPGVPSGPVGYTALGAYWLFGYASDGRSDQLVGVNLATGRTRVLAPAVLASRFGPYGGLPVNLDSTTLTPTYRCDPGAATSSAAAYALTVRRKAVLVRLHGVTRTAFQTTVSVLACAQRRAVLVQRCDACSAFQIKGNLASWLVGQRTVAIFSARTRKVVERRFAGVTVTSEFGPPVVALSRNWALVSVYSGSSYRVYAVAL